MFYKLGKFDGPVFPGGDYIRGELTFGMLIGFYIWRGVYLGGNGLYTPGVLTGFYN